MSRWGRFVLWITTKFRWLIRAVTWIWQQVFGLVRGILGPPFKAVRRWLAALAQHLEGLLDRLRLGWQRLWAKRPKEGVKEARIGAAGVPLLAAATLAGLWYSLPTAHWLGLDALRFVVLGVVLWVGALLVWLTLCREDRRGRVAGFAQSIHDRTGLMWLELTGFFLAIAIAWRSLVTTELRPLALASMVAFVGIQTQPYVSRIQDEAPTPVPGGIALAKRVLRWVLPADGQEHQHEATVVLSEVRYRDIQARQLIRGEGAEILAWVLDGDCPEVESLALQIREQADRRGYDRHRMIECFTACCQAIPYSDDADTTGHDEYFRHPVETLWENTGDCDDTSILLAALLRRAKVECALLLSPGHVAVGAVVEDDSGAPHARLDGGRYWYCETTATGWAVGDIPPGVDAAEIEVLPVPPLEEQ